MDPIDSMWTRNVLIFNDGERRFTFHLQHLHQDVVCSVVVDVYPDLSLLNSIVLPRAAAETGHQPS